MRLLQDFQTEFVFNKYQHLRKWQRPIVENLHFSSGYHICEGQYMRKIVSGNHLFVDNLKTFYRDIPLKFLKIINE